MRNALALAALLGLTACGTTVPVVSTVGAGRPGGTTELGGGLVTSAPGDTGGQVSVPVEGAPVSPSGSTPVGVPGPASGGASPAGQAPGTRPTPRTTARAVTTPLTIGILNTGSNAALAASFGKQGTSATWQGSTEALIRHFNKRGGLAGRQVKPVFYTVDALSTNYVTDLEAACARFTQDAKVDVVMTTVGTGSFDIFEKCIAKAGLVNLEAYDQGSTDEGTFAAYPTLFTVGSPSVDRAVTATLRGLNGTGYLTKANSVGVIVESCPYDLRAYERSYAPLAKELGLTVQRRDVQCVNGSADLGAYLQQVSSAVLPFRSAGVDRVSFISDFESLGLLGFSDQAQSQGWKPGYALTSAAHAGSNQAQLNAQQVPQMTGVGQLPNVDLTSRGAPTGDVLACRNLLKAEGVSGSAPADYSITDTACDVFWLLEEGLLLSRGDATSPALVPALSSIGTTHTTAAVLGGKTNYSSSRRDGAPLSSVFAFSTACTCFRYTTAPAAL